MKIIINISQIREAAKSLKISSSELEIKAKEKDKCIVNVKSIISLL